MSEKSIVKIQSSLARVEISYPMSKGDEFHSLIMGIISEGGFYQLLVTGPSFAVGEIGRNKKDFATQIFYTEEKYIERINDFIKEVRD